MARKPKSNVSDETLQLAEEKFASSGLTMEEAEELGIEIMDAEQTARLHSSFEMRPALKLTYRDPWTEQPMQPFPKWPAFYRIRYLGKPPVSFKDQTAKKPPRYVQPPGSGLCAYFPTIGGVDWDNVLSDPNQILTITEGEFKAAKATQMGFPTIGLGGVHSFKSQKSGLLFLPELERINWVKRRVYIAFDSDFRSNPNICRAMNELAESLMLRGAVPYMLPLPDVVPDGKTGLDDFFLTEVPDAYADLMEGHGELLTLSRPLWKLNEEYTYVHEPGIVVVKETGQKLSPASFKDHAASTATYAERVVSDAGKVSLKPVVAAAAWMRWPLRHEVGKLTYRPGKDEIIPGPTVRTTLLNTWPGWGVEPKKGDVSMFLQLVDHLFDGADKGAKEWFLRWCAYPIKYPGVKLFSAVVLHGIEHGTGKSLVGYSLGKVYGKNFKEIKQDDLHTQFNGWAENKQLILGDEITGSDNRRDSDTLKSMITRQTLDVNQKHIAAYEIPDCINYLFTSNQPDAFFLEDRDRRFFIHEVQVSPLPEEFYVEYDLWLSTVGASAIFQFMLDMDMGDFNPTAPAMRTSAKDRMTEDVRSDVGTWVRSALRSPDSVLKNGVGPMGGDLWTNKQLLALYDPEGRTKITANGLGRELRRAGAVQANNGAPVRLKNGDQDRYYAMRNPAKWQKATLAEVRDHLEKPEKSTGKKAVYKS